jgi:hypothetical protein
MESALSKADCGKTGIGLSLAYDVTESCYEEYYKDFKDNPEGCADEELAYWYK